MLIPDAGTGASNNLIRSLRAGDRPVYVVGCQDDPFVLKRSEADRNLLVPSAKHDRFNERMRELLSSERIDLVMPNTDFDVDLFSRLRADLPCRAFLPSPDAVELCLDKYELTTLLASHGVPVPATYPVGDIGGIDEIFTALPAGLVWCRIRVGSGSMGATSVKTSDQARAWIRYWEEMRNVAATSFTLSEFLPGRDYACQGLWKNGELVLIKTVERLSYFGGWNRASGVSSIAGLAKTIDAPAVVDVSVEAVRSLGPRISGAFSIDLKENATGVPCVTEINVGRFITMMNLFDLTGKHNMASTYVRLALDEPVDIAEKYDVAEDYYFVRDVDSVPCIVHADDVFSGMIDART